MLKEIPRIPGLDKVPVKEVGGFVNEFKQFAVRGNVMDLAVGVIIGGAFGKIVDSIVGDLLMPLVGLTVGKVDYSNLYVGLSSAIPQGATLAEARKLGPVLAYGNFMTILLNFVILAFVIFLLVKFINSLRRQEAAAAPEPPPPTRSEALLAEIRDALKGR